MIQSILTNTLLGSSVGSSNNPLTNPLRTAATQNRLADGFLNQTGCDSVYFRVPYYLPNDTASLAISLQGWFLAGGGGASIGNSYTLVEAAVEHPNGTTTPILFSGGRSKTINAYDTDIVSDELLPTSVSEDKFSAGITIWLKGKITLPATGANIPASSYYLDESGSQCFFYLASATTPSSTDATGVFTYTGTAPVNKSSSILPTLIGRLYSDPITFLGVGDSITAGTGDSTPQGVYGRGYFFNSIRNEDNTEAKPGLSIARGGMTTSGLNAASSLWIPYLKYGRAALVCAGTNDINGSSGADTAINRLQTLLSTLVTNGIPWHNIVVSELAAYTTSSDGFTSESNQTITNESNWGNLGDVNRFNANLVSFVNSLCLVIIRFLHEKGVTNRNKWYVPSSFSERLTVDGIHPSTYGARRRADLIRPILSKIK